MYRQVVILKVYMLADLRYGQCGNRKDIEVGKPRTRGKTKRQTGIQTVGVTHITREIPETELETMCERVKH